jgi:hypothetical protein
MRTGKVRMRKGDFLFYVFKYVHALNCIIVLYPIVLYDMIVCGVIRIALYCTVLYCIVLYDMKA